MRDARPVTPAVKGETQPRPLRPLRLLGSLVYFGIPAAGFAASMLRLIPWMVRRGYGGLTILHLAVASLGALLLLAALVGFRLEGRPYTWMAFRDRMRLSRPTTSTWLWTLAALFATFAVTMLIAPYVEGYVRQPLITLPPETQAFMSSASAGFPEIELSGRWDVLLSFLFGLVVLNIGGEELWWRGIILPRQELVFGRWAWAVNGILWNLFHIGRYATLGDVVIYIPATLAIPYVAQRTRNTWPGIVVHLTLNTVGSMAVFQRIFS